MEHRPPDVAFSSPLASASQPDSTMGRKEHPQALTLERFAGGKDGRTNAFKKRKQGTETGLSFELWMAFASTRRGSLLQNAALLLASLVGKFQVPILSPNRTVLQRPVSTPFCIALFLQMSGRADRLQKADSTRVCREISGSTSHAVVAQLMDLQKLRIILICCTSARVSVIGEHDRPTDTAVLVIRRSLSIHSVYILSFSSELLNRICE